MNPTYTNLIKQLDELDERMSRAHHDMIVAQVLHDEHHGRYDNILSHLREHLEQGTALVHQTEQSRDAIRLNSKLCISPESLTSDEKDKLLKDAGIERDHSKKDVLFINVDDVLSGKINLADL